MNHYQDYLKINERKGFPRSYWFNQPIRWFTLLFSAMAIVYAGWLIFTKINTDSNTFTKVVPFLILFFALNSLIRNLFTLNRFVFKEDGLELHYLLRKNISILWKEIVSMETGTGRQKLLKITYKRNNENKIQELPLAFPKILEILNAVMELTPDAQLDEFMQSIKIADGENPEGK